MLRRVRLQRQKNAPPGGAVPMLTNLCSGELGPPEQATIKVFKIMINKVVVPLITQDDSRVAA